MPGVVKVLCCVLVERAVAASYVPTLQAQSQMYPGAVNLEALFTTIRRPRLDIADLIQVRAFLGRHLTTSVSVETVLGKLISHSNGDFVTQVQERAEDIAAERRCYCKRWTGNPSADPLGCPTVP